MKKSILKWYKPLLVSVCALCLSLLSNYTKAQVSSVTIEASQNITNFMFEDSLGNIDDNYKPNYSGSYALGYRYQSKGGLLFTSKLGMRTAGASYVYDAINYGWNFTYSEVRLGLGYNYTFGKLAAHILVQPYFGYLLKAEQNLNNESFDILNSNEINNIDYGLFASPGINFTPSEFVSIYLDLNYMHGLGNLETNTSQTSNNRLFGATLGVAFSLTKKENKQ